MKRVTSFLTLAALCTAPLVGSPAHASTHQRSPHAKPAKSATSPQTVKLGPLVVTGQRLHSLPLPVKLQIIKAALKRSHNFRDENLSKLVCRFGTEGRRDAMGMQLHCETNCDLLLFDEAFRGNYISCGIGDSAAVNERLAAYINSHHFSRSQLMALLKQLPPPGSSYTFQVKSHGKVVARWVMENGQAVKAEVRKKTRQ